MLEENEQQPTPHGSNQSTPGSSDSLSIDDFNPKVLNLNYSKFYGPESLTAINNPLTSSSKFWDPNFNAPTIEPEYISACEKEESRHMLIKEKLQASRRRIMKITEEIRLLRKSLLEVSCTYQGSSIT
jgi:hypothetical protein